MFPYLRNDKLFGVQLFMIRIVVDVLMLHEIVRNTSMETIPKWLTIVKVPLNFKFLRGLYRAAEAAQSTGTGREGTSIEGETVFGLIASVEGPSDLSECWERWTIRLSCC